MNEPLFQFMTLVTPKHDFLDCPLPAAFVTLWMRS